jgi:hypothetical protein
MFATKPRLFSIGTIVVPTSIWSNQPIRLITSICLNLIKQVIEPIKPQSKCHVSSNIPIKQVLV